jgi:hypothetical protein
MKAGEMGDMCSTEWEMRNSYILVRNPERKITFGT